MSAAAEKSLSTTHEDPTDPRVRNKHRSRRSIIISTVADPPSKSTEPGDLESTSSNNQFVTPKSEDDPGSSTQNLHPWPTSSTDQSAKQLDPHNSDSHNTLFQIMSDSTNPAFKYFTEKLNGTNFTTWRRELYTGLSYLNLDDYIIEPTEELPKRPNYLEKKKLATNIIRMHLDSENSARFVNETELSTFEPKKLWDAICQYYARKSMENTARLMEQLTLIEFTESGISAIINNFRATFQLFAEVTSKKFDRATVEALWVFWVLIKLPANFAVFKSLQFVALNAADADLSMNHFLGDLELEIKRQSESNGSISSAALTVSSRNQTQRSNQTSGSNRSKFTRRICTNGVHNPETSHTADQCYQLHPDRAIAYHQAALDRINSGSINPKSGLSVNPGLSDAIVLDSGASSHFLRNKDYFITFNPIKSAVYAANGSAIPILGVGRAVIHTSIGPLEISEAFFAPQLSNSLIPLTFYLKKGFSLMPTLNGTRFECKSNSGTIFAGSTTKNILLIDMNPLKAMTVANSSIIDLHRALGHPSLNYLKKAYPNLKITSIDCNVCDRAKMHRQPFPGSFPKLSSILDCFHMDLCGPINPASRRGNRYFLKIIDGFSKFRFIFPMRCKSQTFSIFKNFLTQIENTTNKRLKSVVSDNGGEFVNKAFGDLYQQKGIVHHTTAPYTPQQNPFAERGNRTTIEKARTLLMTSGLHLSWWGDAVTTSVYLENRTPDSSINMVSPFERWHGYKPDLSRLIPFGCRMIVYEEKKWRDSKFSPSGVEAVFLGYGEAHHTYKVWVPVKDQIRFSHHVKSFPHIFPQLSSHSEPIPNGSLFDFGFVCDIPDHSSPGNSVGTQDLPSPSLEHTVPQNDSDSPPQPPASEDDSILQHPITINESAPETEVSENDNSVVEGGVKRGYVYVPFYDTAPKNISSDIDPANIIAGGRRHMAMVLVGEPSSLKDPITYAQAIGRLDGEEWLVAIETEISNIKRHEVWVVAPLVPGTRELDTVWVFRQKFDADGELLKYKARLCVRGFRQIEGCDYNGTFAPTGRVATLRLLFGIAASRDWDIQQMDVKCAFLNGIPDEDIFIKVPDGVDINLPPGHGLKLEKSLYGLKQSPRCWYQALKEFFVSINFQPASTDPCLFIHQDKSLPCFVFVHVDDMVIFGPQVQFLKDAISARFEMEDLGDCSWVLGMRVTRDRIKKTISLGQDRYINEILDEFGMINCRPISAPLPLNALTCPANDAPVSPDFNYRRAVGLLNYLVQCTRPDLAFTTSFLSQFLNHPTKLQENLFQHVLRYLQYSRDMTLNLGNVDDESRLVGFSDSSYASGTQAASFSGSLVLHHGPIGWRCAKQEDDGPALSTTEAEYRACSETGQDLRWAEQLLQEINPLIGVSSVTVHLYCDNQGALALLDNPIYQHRTRHINVRHHWLRYHIHDVQNFTASYISTHDNLSDLLTKPLSPIKTRQFLKKLHLQHCLKN
ncbi:hypothetical protein MJO29_012517 [Puccinia striiformis f. sp. tritici]|nr:hypothetical protein MJO29_012517 [Puccinia striiformis f. sp. tritici]